MAVERALSTLFAPPPPGEELRGLEGLLPLAPVAVGDRGLQHGEQVVEPLVADRPGDDLVRLPLAQLARGDPCEQFLDGAPQSER